jgi:S1-C subfamily serine protease
LNERTLAIRHLQKSNGHTTDWVRAAEYMHPDSRKSLMRDIRRTRRCAALLIVLPLCIGVMQPTLAQTTTVTTNATGIASIKIDGIVYHSAAEALDSWRLGLANKLNGLTLERQPIDGRARIVLPDHNRLRPLVAQKFIVAKQPQTSEALEFWIEQDRLSLRAMADALVKTHAFGGATIIEQNDTRNPDIGDADFLVWYQVRSVAPDNSGPWQGHWLVRRANDEATSGAAMDQGVAPGTARYASFVKSVREAAMTLGGSTANGTVAGSQPADDKSRSTVGSGSGIVVDTQGFIVTNNHVVRGCAELRVNVAGKKAVGASLIAHDATNDLAVLKTAEAWTAAASFRESRGLRPGDDVVAAGFPLSNVLASDVAVTTGSLTLLSGPHDDSRLLQLSAPVQPGNSGGPLLDRSGNVIGVVTSRLNGSILAVAAGQVPQNVNFAIKVSVVENFLDTNRIAYASRASDTQLSPADIGEAARKFTVRVDCRR